MKISEFMKKVHTTKDTVRHYEDLGLLNPDWENHVRIYGEKEVLSFEVIVELKNYGLSLKDIQLLFKLKEAVGCGDEQLIENVFLKLSEQIELLKEEENEIRERRMNLEKEVKNLKELIPSSNEKKHG